MNSDVSDLCEGVKDIIYISKVVCIHILPLLKNCIVC
uniref:Uncharacterized protein n=1 Tax=Myoviridae sp. ctkfK18 TaxID=2825165 RepID=A0A8S5VGP4_9CAUD|nr:MAG TPA: hypothetical protein [Myoviridae sp. ctkfK18]